MEFYLLVLGIYNYHAPVLILSLYTDIVITRPSIYLAVKHYACYIKNTVSVSTKRQISITPTFLLNDSKKDNNNTRLKLMSI